MPSLKERLDNLSAEPPAVRADLLAAALTHAEPAERDPIARALVTTDQPGAFATVIRLLDREPQLTGELLAADRRTLGAAVSRINAAGHRRSMILAIELVDEARDLTLTGHLLTPLSSSRPELRDRAAAALLNTTTTLIGPTGRRHIDPAMLRNLDELIAAALRAYEHHRRLEVLLAAALVHRHHAPNVWAQLSTPGTMTRLAVQGVPRQTRATLVRQNLIRWLESDLLGPQAARWLHMVARDPAHLSDVLSAAHLLALPARRRLMRQVARPMRCLPELPVAVELPATAQNHLAGFVMALPISTRRKATALADLVALPSATGRWRAVEHLLGHRTEVAASAVGQFVRDRRAAVAAGPAMHLLRQPASLDEPTLRELRRSAVRAAAVRAGLEHASRSPSHWSQAIEALPRAAVLAAGRRLMASQPEQLRDELRRLLVAQARPRCLTAIAVIRRLQCVAELEPALVELALTAEDPQVCSAAVSALSDEPTPRAVELLHRSLRHQHSRVRANAIDGLGQASRIVEPKPEAAALVEVLAPHALSRENRERANVLRAWLGAAPNRAIGPLRDMLRDPNPMHRISAIWVAGRSQRRELADDLRDVIRSDEQPAIRTRAANALNRMAGES